jgi:parvulin-like peptidyl-prolyl isomerase
MDKHFAAVAYALKPGELSAVIETSFGWHVIRGVERIPAYIASMEERRLKLTPFVKEQRIVAELNASVTSGKKTRTIEVDSAAESRIESLVRASLSRP